MFVLLLALGLLAFLAMWPYPIVGWVRVAMYVEVVLVLIVGVTVVRALVRWL